MEENRNGAGRSFSLRSVLLIILIVGFAVGLTVYTTGSTFAAITGLARNTSQQSTSTTTARGTGHNCTRASG